MTKRSEQQEGGKREVGNYRYRRPMLAHHPLHSGTRANVAEASSGEREQSGKDCETADVPATFKI